MTRDVIHEEEQHSPDPENFWKPTAELTDPPELPPDTQSALERLGPVPFPKSGFPFLGFLATVYDHVAAHCNPANRQTNHPT
jgi:hypothetical protein